MVDILTIRLVLEVLKVLDYPLVESFNLYVRITAAAHWSSESRNANSS
jgi:hypothetical protein